MDDELLIAFKKRMRISHDSENDNLIFMLESSISAIKNLVGSADTSDSRIKELILERARYIYNDSLEFFEENFQNEIARVSLHLTMEKVDESKIQKE